MKAFKNTLFRNNLKNFFRRNKKSGNATEGDNAEENKEKQNENKQEENKKNNKNNNENKDKNKNKKESMFSFLKISQGLPMIKEDALKILNFTDKDQLTSQAIIERYEKYFLVNDPDKGGSYYLQNKIYNAKEFLMKDFPKEENNSKYNLDKKINLTVTDEKEDNNKEPKI